MLMAGLLAGVTAPTVTAVGPHDGGATLVTVAGANDVGQKAVPVGLAPFTNVVSEVSAGWDHSLALDHLGRLYAWGDNSQGEGEILLAQQGAGYKAVAAGTNYSLAINSRGKVEGWGSDRFGLTQPPASVNSLTITAISAGSSVALALDSTGRVHAWGDHEHGQLDIPQALFSKKVVKITAGGRFAVAVTEDKQVFAWGDGVFGQTAVPASVQGRTIEEIDAGSIHTVALMGDGSIVSWGNNTFGQLATPGTSTRWYHVSAGNNFTVATGNNEDNVRVWGDGASTTFANMPNVPRTVSRLSAGGEFVVMGMAVVVPTAKAQIAGTARVGEPLTATTTTWKPQQLSPTQVNDVWYVPGRELGRGSTFTPTADLAGKELFFAAFGTRDGYDVQYSPASITVLPGLMAKQQLKPTISGFAQVGQVLSATASFSPSPDRIQYDWHVDGKFKKATDDGRYTVQPGDLGFPITVHATAFKAGYESAPSGFSDATPSVTVTPKLIVTSAPSVTGTPRVGQTLTVAPPASEPAATSVSYQWMRGQDPIHGATGITYVTTAQDRDKLLSVRSTLSRAAYEDASSASAAVLVGAGTFTSVGAPSVTGSTEVGSTLQASVTSTPSPEATQFDWYAGDTLRSSGPSTYQVAAADVGTRLSVVARVLRGGYDTVTTQRSAPSAVVTGKPSHQPEPEPTPAIKITAAASIAGPAVAGGVLRATAPTTDVAGTATYQWLRDDQAIPGATAQTFALGADDLGRRIAVAVTVQRTGWTSATSTSLPTAAIAKAVPVVKGKAKIAKGRTILKISAVAAGLPAIGAKLTVVVGKKVVRSKLVGGRVTVKLPRTTRPITVKVAETTATSAVTIKVKRAK